MRESATTDVPKKARRSSSTEMRARIAALEAELQEAHQQQAAAAEVLQVINASPGDLAPVFDAILAKAMQLCGAAFGELHTYDGDCFFPAAMRGVPAAHAEFRMQNPIRPVPGMPTINSRIRDGLEVVHVADLKAEEAYKVGHPQRRAIVDLGGARTALGVALRNDRVLLGVIMIYRQEIRPFTDKQIALLQNFAAQAVIAMENARLITETREALEQQTATAEVLQVINSSPGNLVPVFDAILEKAHSLCGISSGSLQLFDGEKFNAVAVRGLPDIFAARLRQGYSPTPTLPNYALLKGEPFVQIADMAQIDDPLARSVVELGGTRTHLFVALRKDESLLGQIVAARQEVRLFSDKEIALLQNFAAQAVIAMENARLITETREALEQQTATAEVLGVINSSPGDLAPVFDRMLEKALTLCDAAHGALYGYDGESVTLLAVRGHEAYVGLVRQRGLYRPSLGTLHDALHGQGVVHVPDARTTPAYRFNPQFQAVVDAGDIRTNLVVALRKDETVTGAIALYRQEVRTFTDKQIALLQNFAAQAVIAMENARLITETSEALEQQTATAEVLGVINSSPGDLAPVFDAMLEKALQRCSADCGVLFTHDGDLLHAVAHRGMPAAAEYVTRGPQPIGANNAHARLLKGEPLVHIPDLTEDEANRSGDPMRRALVDAGGRSLLAVPLRKEGVFLGDIVIYRGEVQPFSNTQIALLENFAAQAVIAMENARLLGELRDRTRDLQESLEYQTATSEVLKVISRSDAKLEAVLGVLVETAARICEANHAAIHQQQGDWHFVAASFGTTPEYKDYVALNPIKPSRGTAIGRMALDRRVVHIEDALNDPEYTGFEFQRLGGFRTLLAVPLFREDVVIGSLLLTRSRVEPFTEKQIALVTTFADQAAIAFENARLLGELRQRTEEVAEFNRGLEARVAEQVEELGRVGRLKRFLASQLAELIVSQGDEKILESHRREIVVVFCDLRGYTAFTETAEPEEVLDFLREYHGALGPLVAQFEGTLDQFSGDGIMVFFNDPVPCPDPAERAVKMATAMREKAGKLIATWRRDGCELGFGIGIAQGYATLGQIGFSERSGYTAIGTVCNLASRLCAEAKDGQILISSRVARAVEAVARLEDLGNLELRGLRRPVAAFNIVQTEGRPNLTVVARAPEV